MDELKNYWRWTPLQPAVFIDEITYYEQLMLIKKKVNEIIEKINDGDIIAKQLQPGAEIGIDGGMLGDGVNFTGAENIDIDTFLMNSVYVSSKVGNHLIFKTKDITPDFKTSLTFLWQELPVNASCGKDNLGWGILRLNAVYKETDADIDYNSYNIEVLDFAFESERNVYNRRKDIRDRFKLTRRINPCDNSKNTMELYYTVPEVLPETECNSPIGPTCLFTLISADTNPHIEFDTQIILMNDGLNDTTYDIGTSGITINPVINYPFDSIELTGDTIGKKDPIDNRDIIIPTETPQLIDSITVQGKAESQKVDIPKVYAPDKNDIVLEIDSLNITPEDLPIATRNSLGVVQIGDGLEITPEGLLSSTGATGGSDPYTLPIASAEVLGGIKIGSNLSITEDGVLSAEATPDPYTLPVATDSVLGGVKVPSDSEVKIDGEGNLTLAKTIPDPYTLPVATDSVLGGVKVPSDSEVKIDGEGNLTLAKTIPDPYTLPVATDSVLGGVKVPSDSEVKIDGEGNLTLAKTIPDPYTLPVATDSILGGVKVSEGSGLSITPDGQLSSLGQYADINLIPVNEEVITYYVDFTNGSDLNTGTQQSPLKSIEGAINKHTTKNIIISLSGSNTEGMILLDAFGYDSIQITSAHNVSVNELVCQNGSITINSGFTTSNLIIRNADLTLGGGTDFNITNSLTVMNSIFRYSNITQEITIPEMSVYNSLIYRNKSMKVSKGFRAYDSQFLTSDSSYTFKITTASGGYLAIENCIFDRGYVDNRALSQITIRNITLNKGSGGGHYFNNVIIQNVSSGGSPDPDQFTTQGSTFYLTNCKINGGHLVLSDLYFAGVCKIGSCQVYNRLNPNIYDTDTTGSDTLLFVNCNCIFNSSMNKNSDKVSFETCVILDEGSNISNYPNTGCAILTV